MEGRACAPGHGLLRLVLHAEHKGHRRVEEGHHGAGRDRHQEALPPGGGGEAAGQGWLAAMEGGRGAEKPGRALGKVADDLGHRVGSEHALAMAIRTSHLFIPRAVG